MLRVLEKQMKAPPTAAVHASMNTVYLVEHQHHTSYAASACIQFIGAAELIHVWQSVDVKVVKCVIVASRVVHPQLQRHQ